MNVQTIPLADVEVGERLREVDDEYVRLIAASMEADGQRTPIEVRAPDGDGRYRLIAGAHRLAAAKLAGLTVVEAVVMQVDDLDAERLEIEENLCRRDLSELDRATFLARWKEVYEKLNPAAKRGAGGRGGKVAKVGDFNSAAVPARFSAVASERLGLSERAIQRAAQRYRSIAPDVRAAIKGTWLASHGGELDRLARMRTEVQRKVVKLLLSRGGTALEPLRREVMGIREPVVDVDQAQFDALCKLWAKTGKLARRRFEAEVLAPAEAA